MIAEKYRERQGRTRVRQTRSALLRAQSHCELGMAMIGTPILSAVRAHIISALRALEPIQEDVGPLAADSGQDAARRQL